MKLIGCLCIALILGATLGSCGTNPLVSPEITANIAFPTPDVPTATLTSVSIPTLTSTLGTEVGPFRWVTAVPEYGNLAATPDGELYLLSRDSAYRLMGKEWVALFNDAPAHLLGIAPNGEIWAAEGLSISRWNENGWITFDEDSGWPRPDDESASYNRVGDILFASDGSVWVATNLDVRKFDGLRWRVYGFSQMAISSTWMENQDDLSGLVFTIFEANGTIWLGGCRFLPPGPAPEGSGLRWFDGTSWRRPDSSVSTGCITSIAQAPDDSVWMDLSKEVAPTDDNPYPAPDQRLICYDPASSTWESHPLPEPVDLNRWAHVTDLTFDASSNPWLEMEACGGASCYGFQTRLYYNRAADSFVILEYEPFNVHTFLLFDSDGEGWLFSRGLFNVVGEEFVLVNELVTVVAIKDPNGKLWALAQSGDELGLWVSDEG